MQWKVDTTSMANMSMSCQAKDTEEDDIRSKGGGKWGPTIQLQQKPASMMYGRVPSVRVCTTSSVGSNLNSLLVRRT